MSQPIDYAEMLEIPVNTLNVTKKRGKKKGGVEELKARAVEAANERAAASGENVTDYESPAPAAEATGGEQGAAFAAGEEGAAGPAPRLKKFLDSKLLLGEFVAVCALCAGILLTNLFWPQSAINTFFRGLVTEETPAALPDERSFSEVEAGSIVSDENISVSVSDAGVPSFTAEASVYAPCGGTVQSVAESGGVYMMEIEHTSSFSSVISGLTYAYLPAGSEVYATIPVGYSDGSHEVTVSMYDGGTLISAYTLGEENDIVWNV